MSASLASRATNVTLAQTLHSCLVIVAVFQVRYEYNKNLQSFMEIVCLNNSVFFIRYLYINTFQILDTKLY